MCNLHSGQEAGHGGAVLRTTMPRPSSRRRRFSRATSCLCCVRRDRNDESGLHALTKRSRAAAGHQGARRQNPYELVLALFVLGATLGASIVLLRGEREARDVAPVLAEGTRSAPLPAFPGIWRNYKGPGKKDGRNVNIDTFALLAATPNALVSTINHERKPVILTCGEESATRLCGSADEALAIARWHSPQRMQIVHGVVSTGASRRGVATVHRERIP